MALKRYRKQLIQAKLEAAAGTAEALAATDAILCSDVTLTPLAGEQVSRDLVRNHFGASQEFTVMPHATLQFSVELAGSGTQGTAPAWGKLLQACGMAETLTADDRNTAGTNEANAAYTPVSAGEKTLTLACNLDGVAQTLKGARGTYTLDLTKGQLPKLQFTFTGHYGTPADAAPATPDVSAFKAPLPATKDNTPTFTLHGTALSLAALSIDWGATVVYEEPLGSASPEVVITDRQPSGQLTILMPSAATISLAEKAKTGATGALQLVHGSVAGQKIQIDMPNVSLSSPTYTDQNGVVGVQCNIRPLPSRGSDEIKITNW